MEWEEERRDRWSGRKRGMEGGNEGWMETRVHNGYTYEGKSHLVETYTHLDGCSSL